MSNENENENALVQNNGGAIEAFGGFDSLFDSVQGSQQGVEQELSEESQGGVDYVDFKKFGTQGELSPWEFGPKTDRHQIHPDSEWIVDPTTFQHGWMGYRKGENGKLIQGQKPDKFLTAWNTAFPAKPSQHMPWVDGRTWSFRAICRSSPIKEHVGVFIENCDNRRMKEGYAELEQALRTRVMQAAAAKQRGDMEQFEHLKTHFYPVVRFRFKMGVETSNGLHNKGIIEHIGWSAPVVFRDDDASEDGSEGPEAALEDKVAQAQTEPEAAPTPRRRGRTTA